MEKFRVIKVHRGKGRQAETATLVLLSLTGKPNVFFAGKDWPYKVRSLLYKLRGTIHGTEIKLKIKSYGRGNRPVSYKFLSITNENSQRIRTLLLDMGDTYTLTSPKAKSRNSHIF